MKRVFSLSNTLKTGALCLIGLPCLALAWYTTTQSLELNKNGVRTTGAVVENVKRHARRNRIRYAPIFQFRTADGEKQTVESRTRSNPPRYDVGEQVTVIYPPGAPQEAEIDRFLNLWAGPLIAWIVGSVFFGVGVWAFIGFFKARRQETWLRLHGQRVQTTFLNVEEDDRVHSRTRRAFHIKTRWQDPTNGKQYVFKSEPFWGDPTHALGGQTSIDVLLHPIDRGTYLMDTHFLEEKSP